MFGLTKSRKEKKPAVSDNKLNTGLKKTRQGLFGGLFQRWSKDHSLDLTLLEDELILADVGLETTDLIIEKLKELSAREKLDTESLRTTLHHLLVAELQAAKYTWNLGTSTAPVVILMVGVNGVGKTTSIGKLARHLLADGKSVQLAAADTFRAAAVEQLLSWGQKNQVKVTHRSENADAGAVIYDALQSVSSNHTDILIADTAGRLHTNINLMEELKKLRRIITRFNPAISIISILTVDANTGNNALMQAREFHSAMNLDCLILSKLDGSAKGGVIFSLTRQLQIPIAFIGVGEQIDDLQTFDPENFVSALLSSDLQQ